MEQIKVEKSNGWYMSKATLQTVFPLIGIVVFGFPLVAGICGPMVEGAQAIPFLFAIGLLGCVEVLGIRNYRCAMKDAGKLTIIAASLGKVLASFSLFLVGYIFFMQLL